MSRKVHPLFFAIGGIISAGEKLQFMPYMLNGDLLEVATEPRVGSGTMYVPLRSLATAMGGKVDWEPSTETAILYMNDKIATLKSNDTTVDVDGEKTELQAHPWIDAGEMMVPVRFFENPLGYQLSADATNLIVSFSSM